MFLKRAKLWKLLLVALTCVVVLYTGSYLVLTVNGRYEPAVIGTKGVKWYDWAPQGFVKEYKQNTALWTTVYRPLWVLDHWFWHTPDEAYSGKYPINTVEPKDLGKVYQAWEK